ncbi:hypothetical protein AB0B45_43105 [Nonomuraea sp. NPDC049152]|uniref:hypothetical protein n=1 Tax=Nonomuraea sp. NPDC049152 TaxID=3154350 RepID=UPI00340A2DA5
MLLGMALAAGLAGTPVASAASTAVGSTSIQAVTQDPAPQTDRQKKLYNKGYDKGFTAGKLHCEKGMSYSISPTGVKWYDRGFKVGYDKSFSSCHHQ